MNQIRYLNEKKNQLIFYNNFKYQYDVKSRTNGSRFFRCVERINPNLKCKATLSILNDQVIPSKEHYHTPFNYFYSSNTAATN